MAQRINYVLSIRETVSNHVGTGGESERKGMVERVFVSYCLLAIVYCLVIVSLIVVD